MKFIKEIDSFEPKHIFECGQCFRWNEEDNGSYTGIFSDCVLNVEKSNDKMYFYRKWKHDRRKNKLLFRFK